MTASDFLKLSAFSGGYLLFGEEEYTKLSCLSALRKALFDGYDDPFNHHKIVCTESGWDTRLTDAVDTLPVFAEKKLVELHSLSFSSLSENQTAELLELFSQVKDSDDTVLAVYTLEEELNVGRPPKAPSPLYKKLCAVLEPVQCERQSPGRLAGWVGRHFAAEGVAANAYVCQDVVEKCGTDMFALANEVKKLAYYTLAKGEKTVDPADVALVCCAGKDVGAFDFTNAIMEGDAARALELLTDMRRRKEKPEIVLGSVIDTISRMYLVKQLTQAGKSQQEIVKLLGERSEYRVKLAAKSCAKKSEKRLHKALEICAEADLKIKSTGLENYTVLEILVLRLCRV